MRPRVSGSASAHASGVNGMEPDVSRNQRTPNTKLTPNKATNATAAARFIWPPTRSVLLREPEQPVMRGVLVTTHARLDLPR
jgi:hypothetical protein